MSRPPPPAPPLIESEPLDRGRYQGLRRLGVAALLALLPACAGSTSIETPPTPRFGESLGLVVKFAQGEPESDLAMLTDLHVAWVRDGVEWLPVSAEHPELRFSAAFQRRLDFYRRHGIALVALLSLEPPSAGVPIGTAGPPRFDAESFGRSAAACAQQLRAQGLRFVLELGNEPHNFLLQPVLGGAWNGRPPSPWVTQYVAMVASAVRQVKAVVPSASLLTDDDMWVLHYWFLEAGLPVDLTGFAIHPYAPTPERTAVTRDTDWTQPFQVVDDDASFASAVRRLAQQGQSKLAHRPQIWVTEWGWPVAGDGAAADPAAVSEEQQAAFLPRAFVLAAAAGVEVTCWFSSQDSVDGAWGLKGNDGRARRAYASFKTLNEQLGASHFRGQRMADRALDSGIEAFAFQSPQRRQLVIWTTRPTAARLRLSRQDVDSAVGVDGRILNGEPASGTGDELVYPVTAAPIYLNGTWSEAALEKAIRAAGDGK